MNIRDILNELKKSKFFMGSHIPLGYTFGYPILQIKNDRLCLLIPFLKYKMTGEKDKTQVYPIRYIMTLVLPESRPVEFADLALRPEFEKVDFGLPIGYFRHEAIQHLDKYEYAAAKDELYACYDKVIDALLNGSDYGEQDECRMKELIQMLTEPCQMPIYKALDEDFYNKYFM